MHVHQIRSTDGTGTLSYLVTGPSSAILIDPNIEDTEKIAALIRHSHCTLTHIFDTHTHADHVTGAGELRQTFGASVVMHENTKNKWKVIDQGDKFGIGDILRANAKVPVDLHVNDGDRINNGELDIHVSFTPGHTDNHVTLQIGDCVFTGDLLLIGQAGRSDLPGGNPGDQYDSLMSKILPLPDTTKLYPGHDYGENVFALLGDEKKTNPFLRKRTKAEYLKFVEEFFPPLAEATAAGGKMTLQCGAQRVSQPGDTFTNITASQLHGRIADNPETYLLDVREPLELMLSGAIEGVHNIPVRQLMQRAGELPENKATPVVAICASGSRSVEAAHMLERLGYTNVMNLTGGTMSWVQSGFPVSRQAVRI